MSHFLGLATTKAEARPSIKLNYLVAGAARSDDLERLHGVHTLRHHLVAVGARGGDDASTFGIPDMVLSSFAPGPL